MEKKTYFKDMKKKKRKRKTAKENQEDSWAELKKLTRIIAVPIAVKQLEDLASSNERKAIWVLCSGYLKRLKSMGNVSFMTNIPLTFNDKSENLLRKAQFGLIY